MHTYNCWNIFKQEEKHHFPTSNSTTEPFHINSSSLLWLSTIQFENKLIFVRFEPQQSVLWLGPAPATFPACADTAASAWRRVVRWTSTGIPFVTNQICTFNYHRWDDWDLKKKTFLKNMYLFASSLFGGLLRVNCGRPFGQTTQLNLNTHKQHRIGQYN